MMSVTVWELGVISLQQLCSMAVHGARGCLLCGAGMFVCVVGLSPWQKSGNMLSAAFAWTVKFS